MNILMVCALMNCLMALCSRMWNVAGAGDIIAGDIIFGLHETSSL